MNFFRQLLSNWIKTLTLHPLAILACCLISPGGGIGRRAGFKIRFREECGFDSRPGYSSERFQLIRKLKALVFFGKLKLFLFTWFLW